MEDVKKDKLEKIYDKIIMFVWIIGVLIIVVTDLNILSNRINELEKRVTQQQIEFKQILELVDEVNTQTPSERSNNENIHPASKP